MGATAPSVCFYFEGNKGNTGQNRAGSQVRLVPRVCVRESVAGMILKRKRDQARRDKVFLTIPTGVVARLDGKEPTVNGPICRAEEGGKNRSERAIMVMKRYREKRER